MATFLLEIRTEEIPANALPGAREQLQRAFADRLRAAGFGELTLRALSSNRRLVVQVDDLAARQPDRSEELMGPPAAVAFAEDGSPTKAAEGFARKAGVAVDQLQRVRTDKGEYLAATLTHVGRDTVELLAEMIPDVVAGLRFPKMMRWGLGTHLFVRPVHGVVALFGAEVVPCELFGVAAGRATVGHRVHSPAAFDVATADDYVAALEARQVLVDPARRRAMLEAQAAELAAAVDCRVHPDPALVAEHVELVEYPGLLRGAIEARYLELPPEVVIITLRHHQKCLILESGDGQLARHFLAVVDRMDDPEGLIRQGNEWVIGARLADAGFFFEEDRKKSLDQWADGLARLDFHRRLGSLADKAQRVGELAALMAEGLGVAAGDTCATARLAKADLLTNMVGEFPELQGIMGGHYLRLEGAGEGVWSAARDHYLPQGFEGRLPASELGRLLAAADRLDTLAGLFGVGELPTGSRDPFALRRAAQALVKIAAEAQWRLDLRAPIGAAVAGYGEGIDDHEETVRAVTAFVADRVRRYLMELVGVAGDTADAVMAAAWSELPSLVARASALEGVRTQPEFRSLALAFKRVRNISDGQPDADVDETLFAAPEEHELWREITVFHRDLESFLASGRLAAAFAAMGPLAAVLDRFFEEVLVMDKDERVRSNRIALLKSLGRDFLTLADLSKLQVEGGEA